MKYFMFGCLIISLYGCASREAWNRALGDPTVIDSMQRAGASENQPQAQRKTNCVSKQRTDFYGKTEWYTDCE